MDTARISQLGHNYDAVVLHFCLNRLDLLALRQLLTPQQQLRAEFGLCGCQDPEMGSHQVPARGKVSN
jgi:hypothetical protein